MYAGAIQRCTLETVETLSDYSDLTPLPGRHRSHLARAKRVRDGQPVVLKQAAPGGGPRLKHEARLLLTCQGPGLVRLLDFDPGRLVLVLEDLGQRSLDELLAQGPLPFEKATVLTLRLCEATARLHDVGVLHLDLNPRNISLAQLSDWPTLVDLGNARESKEADTSSAPSHCDPAWCAPEQLASGKRSVDQRADVYSLGLLLWSLVTGSRPFLNGRSIDALPPSAATTVPGLPAALDKLLQRCLDPLPEARPHSVRELQEALSTMLPRPSGPSIKGFYGQEAAQAQAAQALAEAERGDCAVLKIEGEAGSGKSSLIQSLMALPAGRRALLARGQGQNQMGESPYSAWVLALRGALEQIRQLPEQDQRTLRERLQRALGEDGGMLRRLLPEVEDFLGPQPQDRPSAPSEIERVLNGLVRRILGALAQPGRPLVLVLDDAQWLDPASSRLLESMLQGGPISGMLLVLAWRPEALGVGHPLPQTLESLKELSPVLVVMAPLGREELLDLCQESLGLDLGSARALAQLLLSTSQGIPARLRRTLHLLHRRKLLRYDSLQGAWTWDISRPDWQNLSTDPKILVAEELALVAPEVRQALSELAVLGPQGQVSEAQALLPSLKLSPVEGLKQAEEAGLLTLEGGEWRFSDAEVQEAALEILSGSERQSLHRSIAQTYLVSGEDRRFFAGVDHLNQSASLEESEEERGERAELNIEAAQRARLGSAFGASLAYTTLALSAAPSTWDRRRRLALHRDAAFTAHLGGDQTRAEHLLSRALKHAHSAVEVASLAEIQVATLLSSAQYARARDRALVGLAGFDLHPDQPQRRPTPPQLEQLPSQAPSLALISTGRNALLARTLLLGAACDSSLADWAAAALAQYSRKEGPTAHSALAVAWIGLQIGRSRAPHLAGRLAQTAESVLAKFADPEWAALTRAFIADRIHAQILPPEQALEQVDQAHTLCQHSGQRHAEVELGVPRAWLALRAGHPLPQIERRCEADLGLARRIRNRSAMDRLAVLRQLCRALQGKTRPGRLDEVGFHEAALLESEHTDAQTRGMVDTASLWLAILDDNALSARIRADSASEAWDWLGANACTPLVCCLRGIARLMGRPGTKSQGAAAADQLWLEAAGFEAQAELLRAELLRVRGAELEAIAAFDQALVGAESRGAAWVSLTGARAAAFHSGAGRTRIAESYQRGRSDTLLRWRGTTGSDPRALQADPSLGGVVQAARAISKEVESEGLVARLLSVCVETAGADRGVLVLEGPTGPVVQAWGEAGDVELREEPLTRESPVSLSALSMVRQSARLLRWDEVSAAPELADDPWCAQGDIRSMMAVPILQQGRLLAILVLENRRLRTAFSPERAALMELLAMQVASALEQSQIIADLREQVQAQSEALERQRASDRRYRDLFEAAPDPILLTDAGGRVSDANQAAQLWLRSRELVGQSLSHLLGDPRLLDHASDLLRKEGRLEALRLALPSGESRSVSATWLWSEDLSSGTTQWVFRDVQELVDAAEELEVRVYERTSQLSRSNAELESSNAELRQFATLASHDLKSPIRTVSSYLSLLRSRHSTGLSERGRDVLEKAIGASVRMQALIDDMLSLSQVGQDRRPFAKVDLNAALVLAVDNLDSEIDGSGARVFAQGLPIVAGNELRLSQLLQNLISNAIKYSRPEHPPEIRVSAEPQGGLVQVRVQDNGIGISPEGQRVVFDIFKRLHNRRQYSGNGIGLAICRKIVDMHGGNIWIDAQETPGTCVSFTLPLAVLD